MGVVVQRMVAADAAGVAMTLDPSNGDRATVAIESSFGLGETVVGGTVTPDSFRVDKVMLEITQHPDRGQAHRARRPGNDDRHATSSAGASAARPLSPPSRCAPSPRWPSRPSATTAARRTSSGRSPAARSSFCRSRPETRLVEEATAAAPYKTGLAGIVDTLVNPLASRRSTDDRAGAQ